MRRRTLPRIVVMIPARMASTRLPGKPLIDICGKPMIERVYDRAKRAARVIEVYVATPDKEIADVVTAFGGQVIMTSDTHRSGTDRLAEAAEGFAADDIIINVQGDEPLMPPDAIDDLITPLVARGAPEMASLMRRITPKEAQNPNLVKVVVDRIGMALYFSRTPIPCIRDEQPDLKFYGHIGVYGYTVEYLRKFSQLEPALLERTESLEQLRALENGWRIQMIETGFSPIGVDTEEDLRIVRMLLMESGA